MIDSLHDKSAQKIIFAGAVGAGKTTAIRAISDIEPVSTEVENIEGAGQGKATTTVAMDYGKVAIDDDTQLLLFGTPGQKRFNFMWPIVSQGALGLIVLINNTSEEPLDQLSLYLKHFRPIIEESAVVVGVTCSDIMDKPKFNDYVEVVKHHSLVAPVFTVDVRKRSDVLLLLNAVLSINEAKQLQLNH